MRHQRDEIDTPARCSDCGKLTEADPCSGSGGHDDGFDHCGCEEHSAERFDVAPTRAA
jgi:hypothetical protein